MGESRRFDPVAWFVSTCFAVLAGALALVAAVRLIEMIWVWLVSITAAGAGICFGVALACAWQRATVVGIPLPPGSPDDYDDLSERWPERPSRKRAKRNYRRQSQRRIVVRAERLDLPDAGRMSKALLAAQRELAAAQAEKDARAQEER